MNQIKDDYIKRIYYLENTQEYVSNKSLANELNVSPASVSEMIVRLEKEGWLEYVKYKGVKLTKQGKERALFLIRAHRLWETFLANKLNYKWSEIHEDAELLEHASSNFLIDRLDEFLGFPEYCPHGTPIPKKDGSFDQVSMISLTEACLDRKYQVIEVSQDQEILEVLESSGFNINDEILIKEFNKLRNTLVIESANYQLEIGLNIAQNIFVREIEK